MTTDEVILSEKDTKHSLYKILIAYFGKYNINYNDQVIYITCCLVNFHMVLIDMMIWFN